MMHSTSAFLTSPSGLGVALRGTAAIGARERGGLSALAMQDGKKIREGWAKIPDAITQTDNSAKRQQNAAMRARQAQADEPEALKQMRLKREAEEREAAAAADAAKRSEDKNFVAGQDAREARLIEEYKKRAAEAGKKGEGEGEGEVQMDIREKLKGMQGSAKRMKVDPDALLHQSELSGQSMRQVDKAVKAFLNRNHAAALGEFVMTYNAEVAERAGKANAFMNGSFRIPTGTLVSIDDTGLEIECTVEQTGFFGNTKTEVETHRVAYPDGVTCTDADTFKTVIMRMLRQCNRLTETASVLDMPDVGSRGWHIPNNLFLNQVPCDPNIRDWFYRDACDAVQVALEDEELLKSTNGRLRMEVVPPELNPEMDTFRVGTMLELVRELGIRIALVQDKRVKICIQGSLGEGIFTGLPLMLSGMRRVLEGMDWQSQPGDMYEGILVNDIINRGTGKIATKGNPDGKIAFAEVGAQHVDPKDDVFIIIAPQSMVGASVYEPLSEMVAAAKGKPVILINPRLQDRPSSGGVMRLMGRAERIAFADSFKDIYHFRLLYKGSTFMFPIKGALRMSCANSPFWTVFQRQVWTEGEGMEAEGYQPVGTFDSEPSPEQITNIIKPVANM
eukprot:CAMPEP_0177709156 /NCGR_PEP_ID=MMETSP0484_2-20121128/10654_1 /TAXON_ID=354590 /ORGANISM="Rhodomonas lens, Strain RHODO" /LENGTH=618 /DNA_ID=CAMNT_0019220757 /DNA_START=17 /DNA_END=1873 /DNA_ORIENTATION=+